MVEATICNIISLDICLNGMVARADLMCSLTVRMKRSISGTCYFLDAHLVLYLERSFPCVVVRTCNRHAYVWYLSHAAGIIYVPAWSHLQCSQVFSFWSYFLWKTWCAVIWCWGRQFHWCAWGHIKLWPRILIKDIFRNNCYLNRLHMLDIALHCFDF